jgi:hypothetical protein
MRNTRKNCIVAASLALIAFGSSGLACAHSGGGGGHGGGGGGGHGGGGGGHGGGGFHGGGRGGGFYGGGYHGGWRGGGGGYRGGWRGRGGYGYGWYRGGGWGGLGYGLFFATLPWYYDTYWWDGVPYYYADDNYYQWNNNAAEYETVQPPPGLVDQVQTQAPAMRELFIYPKAGQSNEQLARDREDCHRWAVGQSGFDPTATDASSASPPANTGRVDSTAVKRADYLRADEACLIGRNYSVE